MSSFYTCVPKIPIISCMLPEIWNITLPPPKKKKQTKNNNEKKALGDIIILHKVHQKL